MREVIWTDERGYRRRALVRDNDSDDMARYGIPANPPDVEELDWEWLKQAINNALVDNGLITWDDVNRSHVGLNAVVTPVKQAVSGLFQQKKRDAKRNKPSEPGG